MKGLWPRPSFYFAEPSYLGFFLGFSFFYLLKANWIKFKAIKTFIVITAGIITGSFTFYISSLLVLSIMLINLIFIPKYITKLSFLYVILFLLFSLIFVLDTKFIHNSIIKNFNTSLTDRTKRISLTSRIIQDEKFYQIIFGLGPDAIINRNKIGESNAYMRLFIEHGIIFLIFIISIIYSSLKNNLYLLLFTLIALHSVILIDTPFFLVLLIVGSSINQSYIGTINNLRN